MSRNQRTVVTTDTLREVVTVTLHDTVWEHTTLTLRVNESGDTLQSSTVTDRLTVRDRTRDRQTTTHSRASLDSVAVVSNETTTVAVTSAQHDVEVDPNGNLFATPKQQQTETFTERRARQAVETPAGVVRTVDEIRRADEEARRQKDEEDRIAREKAEAEERERQRIKKENSIWNKMFKGLKSFGEKVISDEE